MLLLRSAFIRVIEPSLAGRAIQIPSQAIACNYRTKSAVGLIACIVPRLYLSQEMFLFAACQNPNYTDNPALACVRNSVSTGRLCEICLPAVSNRLTLRNSFKGFFPVIRSDSSPVLADMLTATVVLCFDPKDTAK